MRGAEGETSKRLRDVLVVVGVVERGAVAIGRRLGQYPRRGCGTSSLGVARCCPSSSAAGGLRGALALVQQLVREEGARRAAPLERGFLLVRVRDEFRS